VAEDCKRDRSPTGARGRVMLAMLPIGGMRRAALAGRAISPGDPG